MALVDTTSFPALYGTVQKAGEREDLTGAHEHDDDNDEPHACLVERPVVELLYQQIETADVILANKCDLASNEKSCGRRSTRAASSTRTQRSYRRRLATPPCGMSSRGMLRHPLPLPPPTTSHHPQCPSI